MITVCEGRFQERRRRRRKRQGMTRQDDNTRTRTHIHTKENRSSHVFSLEKLPFQCMNQCCKVLMLCHTPEWPSELKKQVSYVNRFRINYFELTCLAANSSSRPSPTTTYVGFRPNRVCIRSKQLSLPILVAL